MTSLTVVVSMELLEVDIFQAVWFTTSATDWGFAACLLGPVWFESVCIPEE